MTREKKGVIGFASLTVAIITLLCLVFGFRSAPIIIGGVISFALMVCREVWQYKTKQTPVFEYEDVVEYGVFIIDTVVMYIIATGVFKEL